MSGLEAAGRSSSHSSFGWTPPSGSGQIHTQLPSTWDFNIPAVNMSDIPSLDSLESMIETADFSADWVRRDLHQCAKSSIAKRDYSYALTIKYRTRLSTRTRFIGTTSSSQDRGEWISIPCYGQPPVTWETSSSPSTSAISSSSLSLWMPAYSSSTPALLSSSSHS
jgi:hypothetical protein